MSIKIPLLILVLVIAFLITSLFTFMGVEKAVESGKAEKPMPQPSAGGIVKIEIVNPNQIEGDDKDATDI